LECNTRGAKPNALNKTESQIPKSHPQNDMKNVFVKCGRTGIRKIKLVVGEVNFVSKPRKIN
jgi:hypothetical protein